MPLGDRGGDITNQLIASGMPAKQAISLAGVIGQCMAKSVQRGPAEFYGPVKFSQPPLISPPQGSPGTSAGSASEFALLNDTLTASSPYASAKATLLNWSPSGYEYGGAVDVWPGPLMDDGAQISSGTKVGIVRNGDRYLVVGAGPSGGSGGGGSIGGGGGYVAILQGDLAVDGSASARVATYSGGTWVQASPIVSLTVYAAFQSGGETIPSGYRVWAQRELDGNRWVVTGAKAN